MKKILVLITTFLLLGLLGPAQACICHQQGEILSLAHVPIVTETTGVFMKSKHIELAGIEYKILRRGAKNTSLQCVSSGERIKIPTEELASSNTLTFKGKELVKEKVRKNSMIVAGKRERVTPCGPVLVITPEQLGPNERERLETSFQKRYDDHAAKYPGFADRQKSAA